MGRVVLARAARDSLLEFDWPLTDAVEEMLGLLEREPSSGYELRGRLRGRCSLRVGSHRIIYPLADAHETVRVVAILHRSVAIAPSLARRPSAVFGGPAAASRSINIIRLTSREVAILLRTERRRNRTYPPTGYAG